MTEDEFKKFKENCKIHYGSLSSVYCPVLKGRVNFNSDGFYHFIFKSSRKRRNVNEQISRLNMIPLIKPVIKGAKKIHETRMEGGLMMNGQKIETYHALVCKVGKRNIPVKVVIRKIGNGAFYFHSIMRIYNAKST